MRRALAVAAAVVALAAAAGVSAQRVDPKRPTTLVVGPSRGPAPTARGDARRTGLARTALPTGTLKVAWQRALGIAIEGPPLVTAAGDVAVTTTRGEVTVLDAEDGIERPHGAALGAPPHGAAALLSNGTLVFVNQAGEAIGVRDGAVRFRARIGDGHTLTERGGVLALDDGGAAVSSATELATLDAEGHVRARATLDEPVAAPLVATPGRIAAITSTGKVFLWSPGREPVRTGSFGGPIDGAAALVDDHTLVAVAFGGQLVELDLARGVAVARMSSPSLLLGPPAFRGDTAYVLAAMPGRTFALAIDGTGQEVLRIPLVTTPSAAVLADGGVPTLTMPAHVGPIVDAAGTLAFATPEGRIGVLTKDGALELLGDAYCTRTAGLTGARSPAPPPTSAAFAGLAPAGPRAFVVACETGVVVKVTAAQGTDGRPTGE